MKRQLSVLMLLAALVLPWVSGAQTLGDYTFSTGTDATKWITLTSPDTILQAVSGGSDSKASTVQNIGFGFPFGSGTYTQFSVNTDGNLRLGSEVTGTSGYTNPFNSTYCNTNSPKINFLGCDGKMKPTGWVVKENTVNGSGDSLLVVEFNTSTYNSYASAGDLLWQVHLYPNGNIEVVYPSTLPSPLPAVTRQVGMCVNSTDLLLVNATHQATHYTAPQTATIAASTWPDANRYYTFTAPEITCPTPYGISLTSLTPTEATMTWTSAGSESEWLVSLNGGAWQSVTNPATLTVTPSTDYNVVLRAYCAAGDTSYAATYSFRTPCASIESDSLPWTYGFEDATGTGASSSFNSCLGRHTNYSTAYPYSSTTQKHSGTYGLYMYSTAAYYSYLTLPLFEEDLDQLMVSFYAYRSTTATYGHWAVGVMTDPSDIATFDTIASGQVSANSTWELIEVPLAGYTGTGTFLAILCPMGTAANYTYIDDITVDYTPDCVRPMGVTVTDVTSTSATVNINDPTEHGSYMLYYGDDSVMVSTLTYDLTDLEPATNYAVSVRSICNDGTMTDAANTTLHTLGILYTDGFPYSTGFEEDDDVLWELINGTNGWVIDTAVRNGGGYGLYISNDNGATNAYSHTATRSWAVRAMEFDQTGEYGISFDWKANGESTWDYLRVFLVPSGYAFEADVLPGGVTSTSTFSTTTPAGWIDLAGGKLNLSSEWQTYAGTFNVATEGNYNVVFLWCNDASGGNQAPAAVDNVNITVNSCARPTEVFVSDVTTESATISWSDPAEIGNYLVSYQISGSTEEAETTVTSDTTIELTNLLPNTVYIVSVMSDCGSSTSLPNSVNLRTYCVALDSLPYTQDFEDAEVGSTTSQVFVPCMTRLNNGSTYFGYPYVSSTASYNHTPSGTKGLYWFNSTTTGTYGDYQYVVLPAVDTDLYAINTLQLRFWARATATSYNVDFQVGVMTDPYDASTFQMVQPVVVGNNTTYTEYLVVLSTYEGYGQYVAIRALRPTTSWYATVDDITLEVMPSCPPITGIEAAASVGGAVLSWTWQDGYEAPGNYVVTYDSIGSTGSPNTLNVTTNSAVISGLEPNTTYKAYVQADCGGDDLGRMDSVEFTTRSFGCVEFDVTQADSVLFSTSTTGQTGCIAYSLYGNTAYQAIYTAAELTAAGLTAGPITGIDLGFTACTTNDKEFTIFMGNTSTTSISSSVIEDPQTLVYGPESHPMGTSGWQHYDFDEPFVWDGVSSILLTTFMNQPDGETQTNSTGLTGYYVSAPNTARYRYKDSSPFTLSTLTSGTGSSTYSYRAAIHFHTGACLVQATCAAPAVLAAEVGTTSVGLTWVPGYSETSWNVDYRLSGDTTWTSAATAVTTTNYTVDGLQSGTDYEFRVWFNCTNGGNLYAATTSVATLCAPKTLPYIEDFENVSVLPNCWNYVMTGTSTYQGSTYQPSIYTNLATTHFAVDSKCLKIYGVGHYMLPEVDAPLDSCRIMFCDTITSASYGLIVGMMESGVFVPYDTLTVLTNTRNQYEIMLNNYHGTSRTIAFKNYYTTSTSTYTSLHYIDNIVVDYIPVCTHVDSLQVTEVTDSSISLSWVPVGTETSWAVVYDDYTIVTGNTSITIGGLTSNTAYTFGVRSICDVDDTSEAAVIVTRTACSPMLLPYTEDFESYGSGATYGISPCWTKGTNYTSAYPYPNSTNAVNGERSLMFYAYHPSSATSTPYYSYAALPLMQQPVSDLVLGFNVRRYGTTTDLYTTRLVIGVMTDPSDITTFEPMDTLDLKDEAGLSVHYYEYEFANYTGLGQYIAIYDEVPPLYGSSTYSYSYAYVDDIWVDVIPGCPRVSNLSASPLLHGATVTWDDNSGNSGWNVEYDTVEFAPGTGHMTPVHVTSLSADITGLDSATLYHIYVYPDCPSGTFFRHITVTTLAAPPATLPYYCDFEAAGANGWDFTNGSQVNYWIVGDSVSSTGNRSMYITNDGSSYAYTITTAAYVFASRVVEIPDAGNYVCSFDWKAQGESSFDFIRAALVPAGTQLLAGNYSGFDNASAMPAGGIAIDGGYRLNLQGSSWNSEVTDFVIDNPGTYMLVFLWRNDGSSGSQPPAAIDNVSLQVNTCPMVENVRAAYAGTTNISLDWTDMASGTASWQVKWRKEGTNAYTTQTVSSHPVNFSGLDTMSNYEFRVRPICSEGDTGMWCPTAVLNTEYCDGAILASTGSATGTSYYIPVNNFYKYTLSETIIDSSELAGMSEITSIAYSYAYSTASTDKTDVTIWLQPTNKSVFASSADIEPLDTTIAVRVYQGNLNCEQGWNYFAFDTAYTWSGNGNLLVIVDDNSNDYNSNSYTFNTSSSTGYKTIVYYSDSQNPDPVDPTSFTGTKTYYQYRPTMKLVSCGNAGCEDPTLAIDTVGETTATISWIGSASSYEVAAVEGTWVEPSTVIPVSESSYTFTGLSDWTDYTVGVRAVCGAATGAWVTLPITTLRHPCFVPTGVTVTDPTYDGATVSWTAGEAETEWEVRVFRTSPQYEAIYTVNDNPTVTVEGLDNGSAYSVAVRALCDSNWYSEWSDTVTLTTTVCPQVSGVSSSNVTYNSATVTWTGTASQYEIEYGKGGFPQGSGTTVTVATNSAVLTGLEELTTYDVYVRSICSEGVYSLWSAKHSFSTPEEEVGIDDVENGNVALYPNPASTTVTISGIEGLSTVTVVDLNGRVSGEWRVESGELTIDVSGYAKGAYFVRITGERTTAVRKLVVR